MDDDEFGAIIAGIERALMKSRSCEVIEDDGWVHFRKGNDPLTCKVLVDLISRR